MGAAAIAGAHQELGHDLPAGESKRRGEELAPGRERAGMMPIQPLRERTVARGELQNRAGIVDDGVHLEAVAHDAGVGQKPAPLARPIASHHAGIESFEGAEEGFALLQDREPRESGLVDLQSEPLEEDRIVTDGESILPLVVRSVPRIGGLGRLFTRIEATVV